MKRVVITVPNQEEAELLAYYVGQAIQSRLDGKHRPDVLTMGIIVDCMKRAISAHVYNIPKAEDPK